MNLLEGRLIKTKFYHFIVTKTNNPRQNNDVESEYYICPPTNIFLLLYQIIYAATENPQKYVKGR